MGSTTVRLMLTTLALFSVTCLAGDSSNEVPFKLYCGYAIVVRGSIGNAHNLNLLIDTGAAPSVVDTRIARKLHLQTTRGKLSVFTQDVEVERATITNMQIGLLRADMLSVDVHDLSYINHVLGIRVDGMIGLDFLGQTAFTIDYGSKKITVGPVDPSLTAVPYRSGPGYIVVEMQIHRRTVPLLVDTGTSGLVLFQPAEKDWLDANTIVGSQTASNMSGDVELQKVHLSDAFLGPTYWGSRDAFMLEGATAVPSAEFRGLLGLISLKARRVGFDPDRKVLVWEDASLFLAAQPSQGAQSLDPTP
jgi:predicted aspartyl protease